MPTDEAPVPPEPPPSPPPPPAPREEMQTYTVVSPSGYKIQIQAPAGMNVTQIADVMSAISAGVVAAVTNGQGTTYQQNEYIIYGGVQGGSAVDTARMGLNTPQDRNAVALARLQNALEASPTGSFWCSWATESVTYSTGPEPANPPPSIFSVAAVTPPAP